MFLLLYRFRFSNLTEEEQLEYQDFIVRMICDDEIRDNCHYLFYAAQTLRQQEKIDHSKLDEVVKSHGLRFYNETYLINTREHSKRECWKYINRFIEEIIKDNHTQGKGGVYTSHAHNPFVTIGNIMQSEQLIFTGYQLKKAVDAIEGTLFAKTQTIEAKYRAVELLCLLQLNQPKNTQIKKLYIGNIKPRLAEVLESKDVLLIKGYSINSLKFIICILGILLKQTVHTAFGKLLVSIQNGEIPEQITVLASIEKMLNYDFVNSTLKVLDVLFQFLLNESYSSNNDTRFRAMSILIKYKNPKYQEVCMERFVEIMDSESYKVKVGLLYRFNEEDLDNPKVRYIFDKGRTDTHYWVRIAANRFGNSYRE